MTTTAQVQRLVKPLLARHADLGMVGRWIFVKPVHHFARGIMLGRTSDPRTFTLRWAVVHLFEVRRSFPLTWGGYVFDRSSPIPANFDNRPEAEISSVVVAKIERNALPRLRAMRTFDDCLAFVNRSEFPHKLIDWPSAKVIVDTALGNLDAARAICNAEVWPADDPAYDEESRENYRGLRKLCARLATADRSGLAQLLHEWETATVKNLKIDHLWESTPFPLELPLKNEGRPGLLS